MFTGLVEELGTVTALEPRDTGARLTINGPLVTRDAAHGDSIAVNGVCLTVVTAVGEEFTVDVVQETLERSSLGASRTGDPVNLERPLRPADRLGGHLVQGHVDGVGRFAGRDAADVARFSMPPEMARYLVPKGSITVDGVSLTVVDAAADAFTVALIPTTLRLTTLGRKRPGDPVNLEVDVVAKYVERMLGARI